MPVDESRRHAMADVLRSQSDDDFVALDLDVDAEALPQQLLGAGKAVAGQSRRIALDAAIAGGDIGQCPGRRHVTVLALFSLLPGRAGEPFSVSAVDMN